MKFSIPAKFFAILLTALALTVAVVSALGISHAVLEDLYTQNPEEWSREQVGESANDFAHGLIEWIASREHSNWTQEEQALWDSQWERGSYISYLDQEDYSCAVYNEKGEKLYSRGDRTEGMEFTVSGTVEYSRVLQRGLTFEAAEALLHVDEDHIYQAEDGTWMVVRNALSPRYTATVIVEPEALLQMRGISLDMIGVLYSIRYIVIIALALGLLLFAVGAVYLCCAAGRAPGREGIRPGGLNRLPLDLYLAAGAGLFILGLMPIVYLVEDWYYRQTNFNPGVITIVLFLMAADAVIFVGFCFACAAQFKAKELFWWRHSLIGFCLGKVWQLARWLVRKVRSFVRKTVELLPLTWRWMLMAAAMGFLIFLGLVVAFDSGTPVFLLVILLGCLAVTFYGAYAFGSLRAGAKRLAEGNLHSKINTRYLVGEYGMCAGDLNTLADVAVEAAKKQMKADRMKTELITNVSHDIKTPLTSIINYVDLLEKPHTEEEGRQYLEVLHRQSQRMKKLIEDLMDMSKATTGNMPVEIARVDAVEAVNQALGEFADKLALAQLTPVFRQPGEPVEILADGRLTWRILSNLLSNAVKYALPGTRLYVDLAKLEDRVVISMKNISREELNVSADELTERFVRGDVSRNTEGSGLGLNIAQSLMELQKGQLQLLVDGDLFKVTLIFPAG